MLVPIIEVPLYIRSSTNSTTGSSFILENPRRTVRSSRKGDVGAFSEKEALSQAISWRNESESDSIRLNLSAIKSASY